MSLIITSLAGFAVVIGALIVKLTRSTEKVSHFSLAMALGAMLGLLIFDLGPEVAECGQNDGWLFTIIIILVGTGMLALLDRFIPEHEDTNQNHDLGNAAHIGVISSLAIIVHNIVEGMTVYNLLEADLHSGIFFAIGIVLHNIPMGMMLFSTMGHQSRREKYTVFGSVVISTFVGGLIMYLVSDHMSEFMTSSLVALAGGMILYIVIFELIPHVIKTRSHLISIIGFAVGFAVVLTASFVS